MRFTNVKKLLLSGVFASVLIILFSGYEVKRYSYGAPPGFTGSPADVNNCTYCHGGTATVVTGWITTSVPGSGYIPGNTYTVTVTVPGDSLEGKGFEVSPQKTDGSLLGTLIAGSNNYLIGNDRYVTQSFPIYKDPAVWTFSWIAPDSGTGSVTFWGAFTLSFYPTYTSATVMNEHTDAVDEPGRLPIFFVYPNPSSDNITLSYTLKRNTHILISLLDLTGIKVSTLLDENESAGIIRKSFYLTGVTKPGLYLLEIASGNDYKIIKKVILN